MGAKVVFKPYDPDQLTFFSLKVGHFGTIGYPVPSVKQVVDAVNVKPINRKYKGGGASRFHPRLMLKLLVYDYLTNTYSSRKLEDQVAQNVHFIWLLGMKKPDHNPINRFRSEKVSDVLKQIFSQIVRLLAEQGIVSLNEAVFNDGTNANRYNIYVHYENSPVYSVVDARINDTHDAYDIPEAMSNTQCFFKVTALNDLNRESTLRYQRWQPYT